MIQTTFKVKTIGELLRDKRQNRGLELKQVSEVTRIRTEYLQALEEGNYSAFPSEVYIKGFLKNYAKFLGIDIERALALYRRENKIIEKSNIQKTEQSRSRFDFTLTPEKLILAAVLVAVIGIVYYLGSQVNAILQKPVLEITSPVEIAQGETKEYTTADETLDIKGRSTAGATITINGDEVVTNNLEQFEIQDIALNEGVNDFVVVSQSQFGRESKATLKVTRTSEGTATPPPSDTTPPPSNEGAEKMDIKIVVGPEDANVLVITDGQTQINRVLTAGTSRTFTANNTLAVQTPRPSSVKVTINGQDFELLTSKRHTWELVEGEVKKTS